MIRVKTHPGAIIREDYIIDLGLQQSELADALEVNKATLSWLVNNKFAAWQARQKQLTAQRPVDAEVIAGWSRDTSLRIGNTNGLSRVDILADCVDWTC